MEFRILGPLEVSCDGRPVTVTGRNHPKLLAVLLLEAGHVVTGTRLVEALWEHEPPATARRQVQNTLASLRRQLAGPGAPAIEATGEGYRIVVPTEAVDARRFAELARQGRDARKREDLTTASRLFAEALDLWRGEALAGLSGRVVEAAVLRLNESRLAALEDRCEVDIALGRHGLVIGELRELREHHPYRQRVAGLLMTALHHNGRTPEALEVYTELRSRLSTELGLDPDADLARLHGDILRGDLTAPPAAEARPATPRPAQLPAGTATFTGRRQHLTTLDKLLDGGRTAAVVSAISGLGGAGKTALAVHWSHRVRERFPDGQLYLNLRGYDDGPPVIPADALARFLTALGQSGTAIPTDVDEAGAMYRSLLADRSMLILLDNARDAAQVRPLLPGGSGNFALVTSRDRLTSLAALDDAAPIRLDVLTDDESRDLLSRLLGASRVATEPEATARLAKLCGHLPLALRIAAANLAERPGVTIADVVSELEGPGRLDRLAVNDDPAVAVAHTLDLSYRSLARDAQRLFATLGLLPGEDFSEDLAVHLAGTMTAGGIELVSALETAHLVERNDGDRLRCHDLVHEFASERADQDLTSAEVDRAKAGHIGWHYQHRQVLSPRESANVVSAYRAWREHGESWKLAVAVIGISNSGNHNTRFASMVADALESAERRNDIDAVCQLSLAYAVLERMRGDYESAVSYGRRAVAVALETKDGDGQGRYRGNLGIFLNEYGRNAEAVEMLTEAINAASRSGNELNQVACGVSLGEALQHLGRFDEAELQLRRVISRSDPTADQSIKAGARLALATLLVETGSLDEGREVLEEAMTEIRKSTSTRLMLIGLALSGEIYRRQRLWSDCHAQLDTAAKLHAQYPDVDTYHNVLLCFADLACDQQDVDAALNYADRLSPEGTPGTDTGMVAEAARVRCKALTLNGDYQRAIGWGMRALELHLNMSLPLRRARILATLAEAYGSSGDHSSAKTHLSLALDIFTDLGVPQTNSFT